MIDMTTKHTPSPWAVTLTSSRGTPASVIAPKNESGFTPWVCHMQAADIELGNANARLVAASPELLEALTALVHASEKKISAAAYFELINNGWKAISKATGN